VSDQGVGFEDTVKPLLFDKFGNQGRVGTSGEKSTGLGLYLAKSIMTHHKGELEGNSEGTGKGAVFTLTLPCYKRLAS
jgi:signal transduction histidine kinase